MKASFLSENINKFLPLLNKTLPTNSQVPILSNILILADSNGITLKATDMELSVEVKIPAKTEKEGEITVPGKEFIEVLGGLPKDKVVLEVEKDKAIIRSRGSKISFNTISAKEFPQLYKSEGEEVAVFAWDEFKEIFSYLTFCVSQDEARPQLTGVYIDKKKESLNFVATDGYRMSVVEVDVTGKKIEEGLIVSVELINEALGLKDSGKISLLVNKDENQISLKIGDVLLMGRMIGGSFPDYEKVIPKDSKTTVVVDREQMLQNVKLSSVFARDISNVLNLEIKNNSLVLSSSAQGVGEGELVMDGKQTGEDGKISFNAKYLLDLSRTVVESEVVLKLNSPSEPAVFEVEGRKFKHVIMPIQTD